VASLSQGRTAAAQCGLFTYKSVPVIFEPPCITVMFRSNTCYCTEIGIPDVLYCTLDCWLENILFW